ncbi:MAG: hypothetical protein BWY68_00397 [bacterium ADurb.Bin400]|nr:MAG: hypothetical protein BWY68_00397 [bacterium ADurb.Bin400]
MLNGSTITGQGLKLANILKSYGYSIINIDNAKDKYQRTIIYDYSNGKAQGTIKFLKESLEADVVEKSPESTQSASISIVVGNNYTGFAQNKNK